MVTFADVGLKPDPSGEGYRRISDNSYIPPSVARRMVRESAVEPEILAKLQSVRKEERESARKQVQQVAPLGIKSDRAAERIAEAKLREEYIQPPKRRQEVTIEELERRQQAIQLYNRLEREQQKRRDIERDVILQQQPMMAKYQAKQKETVAVREEIPGKVISGKDTSGTMVTPGILSPIADVTPEYLQRLPPMTKEEEMKALKKGTIAGIGLAALTFPPALFLAGASAPVVVGIGVAANLVGSYTVGPSIVEATQKYGAEKLTPEQQKFIQTDEFIEIFQYSKQQEKERVKQRSKELEGFNIENIKAGGQRFIRNVSGAELITESKPFFEEAAKEELKARGYSEKEIERNLAALSNQWKYSEVGELSAEIFVQGSTEFFGAMGVYRSLFGEKAAEVGIKEITSGGLKQALKETYKRTAIPYALYGIGEGVAVERIQTQAIFGKQSITRQLISGAMGGASAGILGPFVTGTGLKTVPGGRAAYSGVVLLDPLEPFGDIAGNVFDKIFKIPAKTIVPTIGVTLNRPFVKAPTTQIPSPSDIISPTKVTQPIPISQDIIVGEKLIVPSIPTPQPLPTIPISSTTSINIPVPIEPVTPIPTPIPIEPITPVIIPTTTTIPNVTSAVTFPIATFTTDIPPILPLSFPTSSGWGRYGKRKRSSFLDELAIGQKLLRQQLGGLQLTKPISKQMPTVKKKVSRKRKKAKKNPFEELVEVFGGF